MDTVRFPITAPAMTAGKETSARSPYVWKAVPTASVSCQVNATVRKTTSENSVILHRNPLFSAQQVHACVNAHMYLMYFQHTICTSAARIMVFCQLKHVPCKVSSLKIPYLNHFLPHWSCIRNYNVKEVNIFIRIVQYPDKHKKCTYATNILHRKSCEIKKKHNCSKGNKNRGPPPCMAWHPFCLTL